MQSGVTVRETSTLQDQAGIATKVTVERAQLLKLLGHVHRVVERRNTIPILGNVLIRAEMPAYR